MMTIQKDQDAIDGVMEDKGEPKDDGNTEGNGYTEEEFVEDNYYMNDDSDSEDNGGIVDGFKVLYKNKRECVKMEIVFTVGMKMNTWGE
ncbi:hypothetical protein GYH30_033393 [Glycine max]|nr:hypothetical protein GYH30_033393 [Glycine max]